MGISSPHHTPPGAAGTRDSPLHSTSFTGTFAKQFFTFNIAITSSKHVYLNGNFAK
jgi:hypothetical protein